MSKAKKCAPGQQGPSQRVRLRQQQAIAERKAKERKLLLVIAGVVVLAMVVGGVVWGLRSMSGAPEAGAPAALGEKQPVQNGQPIVFGDAAAPKTIQVFADFHCPHCVTFEETYGEVIAEAVDQGKVKHEIYPMSFIDQGSVGAAQALACSAAEGYQRGYNQALWKNASLDWATEQQIDLVRQIGHEPSPAFVDCVQTNATSGWVNSISEVAGKRGVTSTPTIFVDGEQVDLETLDQATMRGLLGM